MATGTQAYHAIGESGGNATENHAAEKNSTLVLLLVKVFAFHLIDCAGTDHTPRLENKNAFTAANTPRKRGWKDNIRLMRVAVRTAKACLEAGQLDQCTKVMETAADFEGNLGGMTGVGGEEERGVQEEVVAGLTVEYWCLRIVLVSWFSCFRCAIG